MLARNQAILNMRIVVTGGAGYIGSVVTEELIRDGHDVTVFDNLQKGHAGSITPPAQLVRGDLKRPQEISEVLRQSGAEAVLHMAADSLVGESVVNPAKYYGNNVGAGLSLLEAMADQGVRRLVFSSTAAVYGEPEKQPIKESDPLQPTNPYGETKLAFERALPWYRAAYGIESVSLRYFNAAGATSRCGEFHNPETHLIPIVLQAAARTRERVEVYGRDYPTSDGTCVRDYIHVVDLARAHIQALSILGDRSATYNLGCGGDGYSVLQVIEAARKITGCEIPVSFAPRRAGDPAVLIASSERIRNELGWSPRYQKLEDIIGSAWAWMASHPNGY
jgi:UDP-glucose 4-epimerase